MSKNLENCLNNKYEKYNRKIKIEKKKEKAKLQQGFIHGDFKKHAFHKDIAFQVINEDKDKEGTPKFIYYKDKFFIINQLLIIRN